jgi:hypothetical protein
LQDAGVAGAGGAGFPSYVKWQAIDDVNYLLVNHQESEPNYYADKWLGREHAADFGELFRSLLETPVEVVLVGTKETYREEWTGPFEAATDATVYEPETETIDENNAIVAEITVTGAQDSTDYTITLDGTDFTFTTSSTSETVEQIASELQQLIDAGQYYFQRTGREVTLEYILLGGVNDQPQHARERDLEVRDDRRKQRGPQSLGELQTDQRRRDEHEGGYRVVLHTDCPLGLPLCHAPAAA